MKATDALRSVMELRGFSQSQLARCLSKGDKVVPRQRVYDRLNNDNLGITTVSEMLSELGYEIVFVPRGSSRLPDDSFVVE